MNLLNICGQIINLDQVAWIEPETTIVGLQSGGFAHTDEIIGCNIVMTTGRRIPVTGRETWDWFTTKAEYKTGMYQKFVKESQIPEIPSAAQGGAVASDRCICSTVNITIQGCKCGGS